MVADLGMGAGAQGMAITLAARAQFGNRAAQRHRVDEVLAASRYPVSGGAHDRHRSGWWRRIAAISRAVCAAIALSPTPATTELLAPR